MDNVEEETADELTIAIRERSRRAVERFGQVALSGVSNRVLMSMLNEVKCYWNDMFRPALVSLSCEAVGAEPTVAEDAGMMLSLADAGISIHDDIVDKTMKKRFRVTILSTYGVDHALLVGDLLIMKAWSMIPGMIGRSGKSLRIEEFTEAYEDCCVDMCEAELADISCRKNLDTSLSAYKEVLWKVNSGIKACTQLGAILGGGTEKEVKALTEIGRGLALLVGLREDARDMLNLDGYLPHRIENESVPLPLLYTAKSAKSRHSKIECIIKKTSLAPSDARALLELCLEAEAFPYMRNVANEEAEKAMFSIDFLKPSPARELLKLVIGKSCESVSELCL